ncbi:glycosyltransferase [Micromonospora coxensis]|uniref:Glycosyltransferase involved in cell wall bisynthesis n=1 Tax=Micromonospora coxensis TaxID=356852 RepID=A0A1C5JS70_9ACTN|nr:glycosyltransferase [Micromonospora coxensis]SCG72866.1 Glycosyltransferase involved in cell wall bisynthesis [Micromonospora coxensis]
MVDNATVAFVAGIGMTLQNIVAPVARALSAYPVRRIAVVGRGSVVPDLYRDFDEVYEIAPFRRAGAASMAAAFAGLRRIVRRERVDLLHLHSPFGIALGRAVATVTGTPHVAVVSGTLFGSPTWAGRLFSTIEAASARLTPAYITLNPEDRETYRRLAPRSRINTAPCGAAGIDPERFAVTRSLSAASDRPPRLLLMGRLTTDKNLDLAVAAWRLARRVLPNIELRIVGSTAPGEPAWAPPVESGLTVEAWTRQPAAEFAAADVVLSASSREGFPMVLVEALTVGTPVVAVSNRGTRALAQQVEEGLTLVPPDAESMAEALLARLDGPPVRVARSVLDSWSLASVSAFHVEQILGNLAKAPTTELLGQYAYKAR